MPSFTLERVIPAPPEEVFDVMRDTIDFRSPLGPLGRVVDAVAMRRHLIGVITERNDAISAHFA